MQKWKGQPKWQKRENQGHKHKSATFSIWRQSARGGTLEMWLSEEWDLPNQL
jgi:hypothetical protein